MQSDNDYLHEIIKNNKDVYSRFHLSKDIRQEQLGGIALYVSNNKKCMGILKKINNNFITLFQPATRKGNGFWRVKFQNKDFYYLPVSEMNLNQDCNKREYMDEWNKIVLSIAEEKKVEIGKYYNKEERKERQQKKKILIL